MGHHSRREFMRHSLYGALSSAAMMSGFGRFASVSALAQSSGAANDYRALVGVFLFGGNDGNNTIMPVDTAGYGQYSTIRGALAIPQTDILPVSVGGASDRFGLHPAMPELQALWTQGKVAAVANVGTLLEPLTRDQYRNGTRKPEQLFSHSDQQLQWQAAVSEGASATGWGGRTADRTRHLNGAATFPMIISIAGTNLFVTGIDAQPVAIASNASTDPNSGNYFGLRGFNSTADSQARLNAMQGLLAIDADMTIVRSAAEMQQRSVANAAALNTAITSGRALTTQFPNTSIGNQLKQVARILAGRATLGLKRQLFFCSLGGFDTHNAQLGTQSALLQQLSQAMNAFYNATVEIGVEADTTTFTLSDFGRTLKPASGGGTDHAWGNHHVVMGGAVRGLQMYGTYPTLALGGQNDSGSEGRWIPTTSVDQYAATLAQWYGLQTSDLSYVFPNIGRFPTANLGFMA
ncbi:MAG: DUF1501 domain-containing protein [Pyrinomonadaceae bacterium MAG19_C2-C3]|nr:DUF1501 domain-containing protein [Pyrinomonadaceae bacterium MAG19_C2-C3]